MDKVSYDSLKVGDVFRLATSGQVVYRKEDRGRFSRPDTNQSWPFVNRYDKVCIPVVPVVTVHFGDLEPGDTFRDSVGVWRKVSRHEALLLGSTSVIRPTHSAPVERTTIRDTREGDQIVWAGGAGTVVGPYTKPGWAEVDFDTPWGNKERKAIPPNATVKIIGRTYPVLKTVPVPPDGETELVPGSALKTGDKVKWPGETIWTVVKNNNRYDDHNNLISHISQTSQYVRLKPKYPKPVRGSDLVPGMVVRMMQVNDHNKSIDHTVLAERGPCGRLLRTCEQRGTYETEASYSYEVVGEVPVPKPEFDRVYGSDLKDGDVVQWVGHAGDGWTTVRGGYRYKDNGERVSRLVAGAQYHRRREPKRDTICTEPADMKGLADGDEILFDGVRQRIVGHGNRLYRDSPTSGLLALAAGYTYQKIVPAPKPLPTATGKEPNGTTLRHKTTGEGVTVRYDGPWGRTAKWLQGHSKRFIIDDAPRYEVVSKPEQPSVRKGDKLWDEKRQCYVVVRDVTVPHHYPHKVQAEGGSVTNADPEVTYRRNE